MKRVVLAVLGASMIVVPAGVAVAQSRDPQFGWHYAVLDALTGIKASLETIGTNTAQRPVVNVSGTISPTVYSFNPNIAPSRPEQQGIEPPRCSGLNDCKIKVVAYCQAIGHTTALHVVFNEQLTYPKSMTCASPTGPRAGTAMLHGEE